MYRNRECQGQYLGRGVKDGLPEEVIFEHRTGIQCAMQISRGRAFQGEGEKAPRKEDPWCV